MRGLWEGRFRIRNDNVLKLPLNRASPSPPSTAITDSRQVPNTENAANIIFAVCKLGIKLNERRSDKGMCIRVCKNKGEEMESEIRGGGGSTGANDIIYNSPFSMCTLIIAGFATNESQAYSPLSTGDAFCISKRLLVVGPLIVTRLMPPLGESKFIGCLRQNGVSKFVRNESDPINNKSV